MKFPTYLSRLQHNDNHGVVAYFDLDRTLIDGYSLTALAFQQISNGDMSFRRFVSLAIMFSRYGLGQYSYNDMLQATVNDIRGMREEDLRNLAQQAFAQRMQHWIYADGYALIQAHRELGHEVVLVTSATRYQAEPVAAVLGITQIRCTELDIHEGCVTGGVTPCYGEGKLSAAAAYAQSSRTTLADAYFYTDSDEDLPLLQAVGHPVVVNGKPALRRFGGQLDWPLLAFSRKGLPDTSGDLSGAIEAAHNTAV